MTALLRAEGIGKSFGRVRILRGVDLAIAPGEFLGLFGANGSGKTTLANILSGLARPDRGRVLFEGRDVTGMPMDARFRIGIARTFQIPGPYPSLSVAESVRVALRAGGAAAGGGRDPDREPALEGILTRTGLIAQRHWPAARLSQGCLRRLELARAISCRPRVVLLDEIFSALSEPDGEEISALLRAMNREEGVSFLLISHNPLLLEEMCGRVAVLEEGRIAWEGPPGELGRFLPHGAHDPMPFGEGHP